jgi:hypothetical protein
VIRFPQPVWDGARAIAAIDYELVTYIRRTKQPGGAWHATTRVLVASTSAKREWRFYNDWRPVTKVTTGPDVVSDNVRLAFFLRRDIHLV